MFSLPLFYNFSQQMHLKWVKLKKKNKVKVHILTDTLFTTFLGFLDYSSLICIVNSSNTLSTYTFFLNKEFYQTLALLLQSDINASLTTLYEISGLYLNQTYLYTIIFNNFFLSRRWFFLTTLPQRSVTSLSNLYICSVWLEREVAELDSVQIKLLKDTRRLLQDYTLIFTKKCSTNFYITKSYNSIMQELI